MDIINNNITPQTEGGYLEIDRYDDKRTKKLIHLYKEVLGTLDENPEREGLRDTPLRVAKSLQFLTRGYNIDPAEIIRSAKFKEDYKEMVLVKDIELFSLCEHHMLPFMGKAHVAYIPDGYLTGLSKIARVVEAFSRRLQLQERLTMEIRDCIYNTLKPIGVAVVIEAKHMCMEMRGVQKEHSVTTTSAFKGEFMKNSATRQEFINLVNSNLH
jgi:GTP cyclohydrolase I